MRASALSILALCGALAVPGALHANGTGLAEPVRLGQTTLRFLGLKVYTATLHTQGARQFSWNHPLSLRLDYARAFSAEELIQGTRAELRRIEGARGDQPQLVAKLAACFRSVGQGDSYVAIADRADQLEMRLNGQPTCRVSYPDVRKRFLGIWLSPNSRFSRLSAQLRGD